MGFSFPDCVTSDKSQYPIPKFTWNIQTSGTTDSDKWDCPHQHRWLVSLWKHGLIFRYEIRHDGAKLFSFMNF